VTVAAADQGADASLLASLRAGDEGAFAALVRRHHSAMLRLALVYVPSLAIAEEVVQDTWLAVLRGVDRFEERSSLRTWLLRTVVNRARPTGVRERRTVGGPDPRPGGVRERRTVAVPDPEPAVDPHRFGAWGTWAAPPRHWAQQAGDRLRAEQIAARLRLALGELPARQREVVMLRDVEGLASNEVCSVLGISQASQRVLLHRGRSRLRQLLESECGRV
jgi:RNA polymerase sigma-70 factor, ECF subfamily